VRDDNPTAIFNRLTSDGDIAQFRKDGTTVGSIGTNGSRPYLTNPTYGGISVADYRINPVNASGAAWDNALNLGAGGSRWLDLYLSGGVYLGGTGAANKLDDYEEGTWTPTAAVGSYTGAVQGAYTKVGRAVHLTCSIQGATDITTATGFNISGLPFACGSTEAVGSFMTRYVNPSSLAETGNVSLIAAQGSFVRMYFIVGTSSYHQVQHAHYTNSAVGVRIGITYFTA